MVKYYRRSVYNHGRSVYHKRSSMYEDRGTTDHHGRRMHYNSGLVKDVWWWMIHYWWLMNYNVDVLLF